MSADYVAASRRLQAIFYSSWLTRFHYASLFILRTLKYLVLSLKHRSDAFRCTRISGWRKHEMFRYSVAGNLQRFSLKIEIK